MFSIFQKAALLSIAFLMAAGVSFAADSIVIKGSTTVLPVAQGTLEAFMKANPGVQMSLSGGGSGEGIKALIDKTTDIATSSREIKDKEIELAKSKGVTPVAHVVAYDAIIPVVHPKNKVKNLSIDQLGQIYQGKITNWKEVGGDDLKIVVISRDSSSGTFESWDHFVMKKAKVTPKAQMLASNGALVTAVSKNKYAIAYLGIGYVNKSVKPLQVNGITASLQTAMSKAYPFSRELYMYTDGEPHGSIAKYIAFVKSAEGQKIVAREGFVPLMDAKKVSGRGKK
ncbi:MAG TPA: phosphate ABC transporter substrate-binding protein [Smithellaceae bacterium]|jgi:phosphate transport system substrate-binding protein|nr:MAG: Phosphate-binding protein PstS 1 precursor [Deltaproteobacteria bacterium ADurb.Bin002]HOD62755.1 phosphate ABC transporter substrate-binding protein [Smithellaceae bacterium]HPO22448.1 phosphate ABC transporter substrate-binding protein [Smithellaceae bacterium]HQG99876.1 phosphate ABC transporter substrate-binding protein [Smithellaceae bacterium]HQH03805.1 phosphate ABC transporter substrate-binding protein [Smithellaceae bacterium]